MSEDKTVLGGIYLGQSKKTMKESEERYSQNSDINL